MRLVQKASDLTSVDQIGVPSGAVLASKDGLACLSRLSIKTQSFAGYEKPPAF